MTKKESLAQYKNTILDFARLVTLKDIIEDRIKPTYLSSFDIESYNEILLILENCEDKSLEVIEKLETEIIK